MKKYLYILSFLFCSNYSNSQTATWTNIGPIPFPQKTIGQVHGIGRVSEIKFHPSDPNKMYCASASGGLWFSNNKGVSWTNLGTDKVTNVQSASLAIDPTNDQTIYWGTGDANYYSSGFGVYKTSNGGTTWSASNSGMGNRLVVELLIVPTNSQILIAATNSGIYKSTNGGANWVQKGSSGIQYTDLVFKPGSNGQIIYAAAKKGFYRSLDAGESWSQISSSSFVFGADGSRLAVSAANPNIVYLGNVGTGTVCELYRSADGGTTWINARSESTKALAGYDASGGGQGNYNFDIEVNPANANELYVCAHVIWRSTDAGSTWTQQQTSWAYNLHTDQHHILFDPYVSGQLWNANDGGVWSNKTNGTGVWTPMSDGIAATEIYRAASSNINKGIAYIGTQDNGGFYYNSGTWYNDRGGDWGPEEFFDYSSNYVYCDELNTRKLYPSGSNQNLNLPFTVSNTAKSKYAFCPANTSIGYVANSGKIYRSSNLTTNSPAWTLIFTLPSGSVKDLETDPSNANELYIISNDQKIYRSDNATAATPTFATGNMPSATNNAGWVAPINGTNVVYASANTKIYRSVDKGTNWADVTTGFPNANINGLVADRFSPNNESIYASYANGVYYRDNTKTSWSNYSQGLPIICDITDLFYYNDATKQGQLRVSFYGRGMWETPMVGLNNNITISLTTPTNGSSYTSPANINLTASASATIGSISKVEFYQGTTLLFSDNNAPYDFNWTNVSFGKYAINAVAYDNTGNSKSSATANITVNLVCNKLTGTAFGTTPAYAAGSEFNKAFDGNLNTFVDVVPANAGFTGLDLGTPKIINAIRFYPRDGQEGRMDGGIFQASNSSNFSTGVVNLYTVNGSPSLSWNETPVNNTNAFRYVRYLSPNGGYCNVAEIEFCGSSTNQSPIVTITSPTNNLVVDEGTNQTITATATDNDGSITSVTFFNGTTSLGQNTSSPYSYSWNNLIAGSYTITAVAIDNLGQQTTSLPITLKVNKLPNINITNLTNNSVVNEGVNLVLTANASDTDGSISKVEFFNGNTLIGSSTTSPFNYIWNSVAAGNYIITAKATDNNGGSKTSTAINIKVNKLPTIVIASPINNYIINEGNAVTFTVNTSDTDGSISKVEFFNGSTLLTQSSVSPFTATTSSLTAGNYTIIAKATDNNNGSTNSAIINLIVNKLPTIAITSPTNNGVFQEKTTVTLSVTSADADGTISKVEYFNNTTKLGESTTSPFGYVLNNIVAGSYSLIARATDNRGGVATSNTINLFVNKAPTISITSPANNSVVNVGSNLTLAVDVKDLDGLVSKVEYFNGTTLIGQSTTTPFTLVISSIIAGNYTFSAKVTDNNGGTASSTAINVKVNNPPTISITAPSNNAVINEGNNLLISTNAIDVDGTITKVEFYNGNTLIGQSTIAPFNYSITNPSSGNYTLTAKAIDNNGAQKISTAVNVVINKLPTVNINSPSNNSVYQEGVNLNISVNALDIDGNISKVEFYNGATLIGQSLISPYNFTISSIPAGAYTLTAKAFDNRGAAVTSLPVNFIVNTPVNQSPLISITNPIINASFMEGDKITINVNASDTDGTINKVEFYNGSTLIGQATNAPYSFTINNTPKGLYALTAKAFDNKNATANSNLVSVVVKTIPTILINNPTNNAIVGTNSNFNISVVANDIDNAIAKVEYYLGILKIGESNNAPYNISAVGLSSGNYTITAKAISSAGTVISQSSINITANSAPTISISSPSNNLVMYAGDSILVTTQVSDKDGSITKVEFYNGTTLLGTVNNSPYTWNLEGLNTGNYVLTAKAWDNNGVGSSSNLVNVIVKSKVSLSFVSPINNTILTTGTEANINLLTNDADGAIDKVIFYRGLSELAQVRTTPFTFNYSNILTGSQAITAKSFDINGRLLDSENLTLIGNNGPAVNITNPFNNTVYNENSEVQINIDAKDLDGNISKVELYVNGVKIKEMSSLPYSINLNTLKSGNYQLTARAYDNLGWDNTSSVVQLRINALPKATIDSPQDKKKILANDTLEVTVTAIDNDGSISKVVLYNGGMIVEEKLSAPYNFNVSNLSIGSHSIKAVAFDNNNASSTSQEIEVIVEDQKTGIATNSLSRGLELFPNPNNGQFTFSLNQYQGKNITYRVIDMAGSEVIPLKTLGNNNEIQLIEEIVLPTTASGNYLLQITADNEVISKKLVVVRLPKTK